MQKTVSQLDADGYYVGPVIADESPLEPGVWLIPAGAVDASPPDVPDGQRAVWSGAGWALDAIPEPEPEPEPEPAPELTDAEKRELRYRRRAAVRDELLAWMAADNEGRILDGTWTLADYTGMLADPQIAAAMQFMQVMAYELTAQSILASEHPLMTPDIKAAWSAKLAEHFYNDEVA